MNQPMPTGPYTVHISIQRRVESHLDKTRAVGSRFWCSTIFNKQNLTVKSKEILQQADTRELTA